jgi:hypothetical protein
VTDNQEIPRQFYDFFIDSVLEIIESIDIVNDYNFETDNCCKCMEKLNRDLGNLPKRLKFNKLKLNVSNIDWKAKQHLKWINESNN